MSSSELKFNLEKCLTFINTIEDFEITTEIHLDYRNRVQTYGKISVKEHLKKFLIECKKESVLSEHDFIKWIEDREFFWRGVQRDNVTEINSELTSAKGDRKEKLESQKLKVIDFCNHYYSLIKMMKEDIYNGLGDEANKQSIAEQTVPDESTPSKIQQGMADNEFEAAAKAKGLKPGTIAYHNYIIQAEGKKQDENRPLQEERDRNKWIDKDFTFANTLEDYNRIMGANKRALPANEYILLLLRWQEIYGNSSHFYTIWGPDNLLKNHNEIYRHIKDELDIINSTPPQKEQLQPPESTSAPFQYFNKFIIEVQTIEIKIKEYYVENGKMFIDWTPDEVPEYNLKKEIFLDLSHYDQHKSDYAAELKQLQQLALNEALLMNPDQLKLQLNRLEQIKKRYKEFWALYMNYLKNPSDSDLFQHIVFGLFIIAKPPQPSAYGSYPISDKYVHDWHDAIMFKESYLLGFDNQIKRAVGITDTNTEQPKQGEVTPPKDETIKEVSSAKSNKRKHLTLSEIWSDSKEAERHNEISLLINKEYIKQDTDQSYQWLGKQWKKLAAITEIWKDKDFLKPNWQKFGNQRELCSAVCRHFGIAENKIQSIYNTGFKASIISIEGELNEDMKKIKQEILISLTD